MLDINLVHKNDCWHFELHKSVRTLLFDYRRNVDLYIPANLDPSTLRPIIKMFGGSVKTMPICFGKFMSSTDTFCKSVRTAVMLNYYSKSILGPRAGVSDLVYIYSPLGKVQMASVVSTGITMIMFVGNVEPTIIDTRDENYGVLSAIDEAETQSKTYLSNSDVRLRAGMHCALCQHRDDCI